MAQGIERMKEQYDSYISSKQREYEVIMQIISTTIKRMVNSSVISDDVDISGRLKSFKSAYENVVNNKKLDDCFGLRIIAGTEEDLEKIKEALGAILVIEKNKNHKINTSTKYNAFHQMAKIKPELATANNMDPNNFPTVEIQYWTRDIEKACVNGELAYSKYKRKDIQKIYYAYRKEPETVYALLPTFYGVSEGKIKILSREEAFAKMYPEINEILSRIQPNKKDVEEPDAV